MITIDDIRNELGEAYSNVPDAIIQNFINKRENELKELIQYNDLSKAPYPYLLKKWLMNVVCIDILKWDMLGKDSADSLNYSIGDLKENKDLNIKLKLEWIQMLKEDAEKALNDWFTLVTGYRAVAP